jgi:hypothetical protein
MKPFLRLFGATLAMTTIYVLALLLILLTGLFAYAYLGLIQALAAMVFGISLAITALIHWSEQDSFPFR